MYSNNNVKAFLKKYRIIIKIIFNLTYLLFYI